MKKTLVWLSAMILSGASLMAQEQLDFNHSAIPEVKTMQKNEGVVSNHSLSATILGLEYSFEGRLGQSWSLITRVGVPMCLASAYLNQAWASTEIKFNFRPQGALTLEPRYYFNMQKRVLAGKKTVNNSANFFSIQTKVYDARWDETVDVQLSVIPTFGIRRSGGHWFREYTLGIAYHTKAAEVMSSPILPSLNFRLGYSF